MKKQFLKLRLLPLLILLLVFANCQDDPYENTSALPQAKDGKFSIITGQKAAEIKSKLITHLKKGDGSAMQKLSNTIINDPSFRGYIDIEPYIDDSSIIGIENTNGVINYSLGVNMPDSSPEKFYNVVFSTYNNSERIVLVTYNLEKQFSQEYAGINGDMGNFTGTIDFEPISTYADHPCDTFPSIPIPVYGGVGANYGGGGGDGGDGGDGGGEGGSGTGDSPHDPGSPYNPALIDAQFLQLIIVKPKAKIQTITTGPIEPTGGGPVGTGGTDFPVINFPIFALSIPGIIEDDDDPCNPLQQIGIIEPHDPEKDLEKNCDELKKFTQIPENLDALKGQENTAIDNDEDGYSYSDDSDPQELEKDGLLVVPRYGGSVYGNSHDHPNPSTTSYIPMFSISDIASLGLTALKNQSYPKNYNKFIITLSIIKGGGKQTFALKIDDYLQFISFVNYFYSSKKMMMDFETELAALYTTVNPQYGTSEYLKVLFKYMNKKNIKGVSIYKANDNEFSSWSRLTYDPESNDVYETPCK